MLGRMGAGGLQQLETAQQVRLDIGAGVVDGIAHTRLPGQMDHGVGPIGGEQIHQQAGIFDLAAHCLIAGARGQPRLACGLQAGIVIIVVAIEADDLVPFVQQ